MSSTHQANQLLNWASTELTWNSARLGLLATRPDVPVEGTCYEHPGDFFPSDIYVRLGALRLDPVSWHKDIGHVLNGHLFPVLPPRPATAALPSASASEGLGSTECEAVAY